VATSAAPAAAAQPAQVFARLSIHGVHASRIDNARRLGDPFQAAGSGRAGSSFKLYPASLSQDRIIVFNAGRIGKHVFFASYGHHR
jgi:hypothetical protein